MDEEQFDFTEKDLSTNDVLYTDMILQLIGSWFDGDKDVISSVVNSISDEMDGNETTMVGLLFASITLITKLIDDIAHLREQSLKEAWAEYLTDYNLEGRDHYSKIPILHPKITERLAKEFKKRELDN